MQVPKIYDLKFMNKRKNMTYFLEFPFTARELRTSNFGTKCLLLSMTSYDINLGKI